MPALLEADNLMGLRLRAIAGWQIESPVSDPAHDGAQKLCAELPALQRAAVWSAVQIEAFWDSLIRGFPVGTFLVAPYQEGFGVGLFKLGGGCRNADRRPDLLLLDGQQRATAIALGFLDLWTITDQHCDGPALWVDVAPPAEDDERDFVFRLLTRSHPWGYRRDDPKSRLAHGDIRDAMACFLTVSGVEKSAAQLPLLYAWPWDAKCPLPVALLLGSAGEAEWRDALRERLQALPMWCHEANPHAARLKDGGTLVDRWKGVLNGPANSEEAMWVERLERLVDRLKFNLENVQIPALVLPHVDIAGTMEDGDAIEKRKDAVETLFVRVNSAGTPLAGEELIYSSLKAAWSEAPTELRKLQPEERQIVTPARLVSLLWRLHTAFPEGGGPMSEKLPGTPAVGDFRRAMRKPGAREAFKRFVRSSDNMDLFVELLNWVRLGDVEAAAERTNGAAQDLSATNSGAVTHEPWRLPPTLAAQLFAGVRGVDTLFIVAAWLICLRRSGRRLADLTPRQRKRSLGFIVATNWFADRLGDCISRLWSELRKAQLYCADYDLGDFLDATRFHSLLRLNPDSSLVMLPIVPPEVLEGLVNKRVTDSDKGFPSAEAEYWKPGSGFLHFYSKLAPAEFDAMEEGLRHWLKSLRVDHENAEKRESEHAESAQNTEEDGNLSGGKGSTGEGNINEETLRLSWSRMLDKMWGHRPLVDYAQRDWLARWFPDFDPTLPGQMEDLNRPWDYDHIHPTRLGSDVRNLPAVIRDWHQSIGNLRAWPLELNRGDQADAPAVKLSVCDVQTAYFGMTQSEDLLRASFIDVTSDWPDWQATVPEELPTHRYLALVENADFDASRQALLRAITCRFCRLYREWYENLSLGDLYIFNESSSN